MSTVADLLLWDRNVYENRLGKRTLVGELPVCSTMAARLAMRWDSTWGVIATYPSWNTVAERLDTPLSF